MARATVLKRFEFDPELALHIETRAKAMEISQTAFVERLITADRAQSHPGAIQEIAQRRNSEFRADIQTDSKPVSKPKRVKKESRPGHRLPNHYTGKLPKCLVCAKRVLRAEASSLNPELHKQCQPVPASDAADATWNPPSGTNVVGVIVGDDTACIHPSGNRTAGKNWRCTACGFQNVAG